MQTSEEYLDIHEWQIRAIEEGIAAAKKGKTKNLEEVKQHWEKKLALSGYRGQAISLYTSLEI